MGKPGLTGDGTKCPLGQGMCRSPHWALQPLPVCAESGVAFPILSSDTIVYNVAEKTRANFAAESDLRSVPQFCDLVNSISCSRKLTEGGLNPLQQPLIEQPCHANAAPVTNATHQADFLEFTFYG